MHKNGAVLKPLVKELAKDNERLRAGIREAIAYHEHELAGWLQQYKGGTHIAAVVWADQHKERAAFFKTLLGE